MDTGKRTPCPKEEHFYYIFPLSCFLELTQWRMLLVKLPISILWLPFLFLQAQIRISSKSWFKNFTVKTRPWAATVSWTFNWSQSHSQSCRRWSPTHTTRRGRQPTMPKAPIPGLRATYSKAWLTSSKSPDLNCIEKILVIMKRKMGNTNPTT